MRSRICGLDGHIQGRRGLVGDQQLRLAGQGHGDHHPLAQPAGQLVWVLLEAFLGPGHAHEAEHFDGPVERLLLGHPLVDPDRLRYLAADGPRRVQRRHRVLEDHADVVATHLAHLGLGQGRPGRARSGGPLRRRCGRRWGAVSSPTARWLSCRNPTRRPGRGTRLMRTENDTASTARTFTVRKWNSVSEVFHLQHRCRSPGAGQGSAGQARAGQARAVRPMRVAVWPWSSGSSTTASGYPKWTAASRHDRGRDRRYQGLLPSALPAGAEQPEHRPPGFDGQLDLEQPGLGGVRPHVKGMAEAVPAPPEHGGGRPPAFGAGHEHPDVAPTRRARLRSAQTSRPWLAPAQVDDADRDAALGGTTRAKSAPADGLGPHRRPPSRGHGPVLVATSYQLVSSPSRNRSRQRSAKRCQAITVAASSARQPSRAWGSTGRTAPPSCRRK